MNSKVDIQLHRKLSRKELEVLDQILTTVWYHPGIFVILWGSVCCFLCGIFTKVLG